MTGKSTKPFSIGCSFWCARRRTKKPPALGGFVSLDKPVSSPSGPPNAESPANNDEEHNDQKDEKGTSAAHEW